MRILPQSTYARRLSAISDTLNGTTNESLQSVKGILLRLVINCISRTLSINHLHNRQQCIYPKMVYIYSRKKTATNFVHQPQWRNTRLYKICADHLRMLEMQINYFLLVRLMFIVINTRIRVRAACRSLQQQHIRHNFIPQCRYYDAVWKFMYIDVTTLI